MFFRAAPTPGASALAPFLARFEAEHGDTVSAFDHLTLAIRNFHNAGDTTTLRVPLASLAALFDRLGRYEPAATFAGFALSALSASAVPEITTAITHLREVFGEATYESLARKGETMTTAAKVTYAYDQSTRPEQNSNTPAECPSEAEALGEGVGVQKSVRAPHPRSRSCSSRSRPSRSLRQSLRFRQTQRWRNRRSSGEIGNQPSQQKRSGLVGAFFCGTKSAHLGRGGNSPAAQARAARAPRFRNSTVLYYCHPQ